jgi:hypothetical protein
MANRESLGKRLMKPHVPFMLGGAFLMTRVQGTAEQKLADPTRARRDAIGFAAGLGMMLTGFVVAVKEK